MLNAVCFEMSVLVEYREDIPSTLSCGAGVSLSVPASSGCQVFSWGVGRTDVHGAAADGSNDGDAATSQLGRFTSLIAIMWTLGQSPTLEPSSRSGPAWNMQ